MLKTNKRLDKIAAAWVDFNARGMLADSCLFQTLVELVGEDLMDENMDEDIGSSETDSEASGNRIQTPGQIHAGGRNVDLDALGGPIEETVDEHSRLPTPPTNYDDNDPG
jgi:hypothetical protein